MSKWIRAFAIVCAISFLNSVEAVTTPPTLSAPIASTVYRAISISYVLPQTPLSGSVTLTFTDGGSHTIVLHLVDSAASATVSFTWDPTTNPAVSLPSYVTSITGGPTLPAGTYTATLSYQNTVPDLASSASASSVGIRLTTPTPVLTSPSASSSASTLSLSYSLPVAPTAGSVHLTFNDGSHSTILTMVNSTSVSFSLNPSLNPSVAYPSYVSSISGGTSIPDGSYTLSLSYQDALGNPTASVSHAGVTIDTTTQSPTLTKPASSTTLTDVPINFSLPEGVLAGSRILTFVSEGQSIALTLKDSTSTDFTLDPTLDPTANSNIQSATASSIPDGTYSVTLSYRDSLGNPASTATNTGVIISHQASSTAATSSDSGGCRLQDGARPIDFSWGFLGLFVVTLIFFRRWRSQNDL